MKKTLLTVLALLSFSTNSLAFPIYMPDYKRNTTLTKVSPWIKNIKTRPYFIIDSKSNPKKYRFVPCDSKVNKEGVSQEWSNHEIVYNVGFTKCNGNISSRPFWIHNVEEDILYIDNINNISNHPDGIVDEIIKNPRTTLYEKAPECDVIILNRE